MDYNNNNNISNQYLQQPYQGQFVTPQMQMEMEKKKEDDRKATILCIASIICTIFGYSSYGFLGSAQTPEFIEAITPGFIRELSYYLEDFVSSFAMMFAGFAHLAGFVLMIIARVKYPKNTFAKVLMWLYIIGIIITTILVILVIASCYYIMSSCAGF